MHAAAPIIWILFVLGSTNARMDFGHPRSLAVCLAEVNKAVAKDPDAIAWCSTFTRAGATVTVGGKGQKT